MALNLIHRLILLSVCEVTYYACLIILLSLNQSPCTSTPRLHSSMGHTNHTMLISITKNEQHQTDTTNSLAHQHPPWNRVLPKKLAGPQLIKKFPVPILHQINPVHASPSHVLKIHFNIILPPMPRFPSGLLPSGLPTKTLNAFLLSPNHITWPADLILLDFITRILHSEEYRSKSLSLRSLLHSPVTIHDQYHYYVSGGGHLLPANYQTSYISHYTLIQFSHQNLTKVCQLPRLCST